MTPNTLPTSEIQAAIFSFEHITGISPQC